MARYWRISGIQTPSNTLDVQALALSDGTTDYPTAVLSGALSSGFKIIWDLGADIAITQLKLTSTVQADWPYSLLLESSLDAQTWAGAPGIVATISYPGNASAATVVPAGAGTTPPTVTAISQPSGVTNIADEFMPASGPSLIASGVSIVDILDGGAHRVAGTAKNTPNLPVVRRVALIDERSRRVVRETWSDTAGNYSFDCINANTTYTVLAYDHTETYRAVVADRVLPEAMP